jgi:hypothetical protein
MKKSKLSVVKFKIEFEFSKVNNKTMSVDFLHETHKQHIHPTDAKVEQVEITIELPTTIKLVFLGKTDGVDTIVDGIEIIEDLHVKISNIWLDDFAIHLAVLQKMPVLNTHSSKIVKSNYIGFNGDVNLIFNEKNVFDQIMYLNRNHL